MAFETFVQEIKSKIISIIFYGLRLDLFLFLLLLCFISFEIDTKKKVSKGYPFFLCIHLLYTFFFISILSFTGFSDKKQINHQMVMRFVFSLSLSYKIDEIDLIFKAI